MAAAHDHPPAPPRLAERLRELRERQGLTQGLVARVLGGQKPLSTATISLWEKPDSGRMPSPQQLAAYARLFCTARSFGTRDARLLGDDELDGQERQRQAELYQELLALRNTTQAARAAPAGASGPRSVFWHFPEGRAVSIVGSDAADPPPYASPDHPYYTRYARFADLDALIEIFGELKAENPGKLIRILAPEDLVRDFALNHLVVIGGAAVYDTAPYFAEDIPLPAARPIPARQGWVFECAVGDEKREFTSEYRGESLTADVGVFARGPHPNVPSRTVTLLSGITSRGVHGAALCFTDPVVRADNEMYLRETFGDTEAFCVVVRVPVRNDEALPPNLRREHARLYEWSPETGARW
jgi:transcriptional regulator with XRE-family HTH domain